MRLGFVGLGVMGGAMAANLVTRGGHDVAGFDVNGDAIRAAAARGVQPAGTLSAAAASADVVFLALPGEAEVRAACLGDTGLIAALGPGQTLVDCSTVPVALCRTLGAAAAERGAGYADAPIAGTAETVADAEILLMVGATPETFEAIAPLLGNLAKDVRHCGGVGAGATVKLLLNMVIAQSVVALAEALTLARRAGVAGDTLFEAFATGCDSFALREQGMKALLPGVFPEQKFPTKYMLKDLRYALQLAESEGLSFGGMSLAERLLSETAAMGLAEAYWPAVIKTIERAAADDGPERESDG